jgi:hypothetical protein
LFACLSVCMHVCMSICLSVSVCLCLSLSVSYNISDKVRGGQRAAACFPVLRLLSKVCCQERFVRSYFSPNLRDTSPDSKPYAAVTALNSILLQIMLLILNQLLIAEYPSVLASTAVYSDVA